MLIVKAKVKMRDGSLSFEKDFIYDKGKLYPLDLVFTQPPIPQDSVVLSKLNKFCIKYHDMDAFALRNESDCRLVLEDFGDKVADSLRLGEHVLTLEEDREKYSGRID